jgi:hypothetical protein
VYIRPPRSMETNMAYRDRMCAMSTPSKKRRKVSSCKILS